MAKRHPTRQPACTHRWRIEPPAGPTSRGVCRLCGAEREFRNSFPDVSGWESGATDGRPFPRQRPDLEPAAVNDVWWDAAPAGRRRGR